MAVEIGALRALLSLDSAAFDKGAKRAQASMNGLQRSLAQTSEKMRSIGRKMSASVTAPLAGIAAVAVKTSLSTVDAQAKLAQSLDTTVESMQTLDRAAQLAGVSTSGLEQLSKDLTRRLSQASSGAGPAAKALDRIGLSAEDLMSVPLDERIATINAAIDEFVPAAERAAVAGQLFGEEGSIAAMRLDADTIGRAADEVARFGIAVSEVDADKIEEANDAISAIKLVSQGLANQITTALAPTLISVAETIADWGAKFSALSPEMKRFVGITATVAAAIGPLALALGFVAAGLAALASPIGLVVLGFGAAAGVAAYVATKWDSLKERFPILETGLTKLKGVFTAVWEGIKGVVSAAADIVNGAIQTIIGVLTGDLSRAVDGLRSMWDGWKDATDAAINAVLGIIEAIVPGFQQAVADIIATVQGLPARLMEWGKAAIQSFVDGIKQKWAELKESVFAIFDWSKDQQAQAAAARGAAAARRIGQDIGAGISAGVKQSQPAAESEIRGYLQGLEGAARDETETQSPSRVWMRLGEDLMAGLGVGIAREAMVAAEKAAAAAGQVTAAASAAGVAISNVPETLGDAANEVSDLNQRFASMFSSAAQGAQSLSDFLSQIGQQLSSMLINDAFSALFGGGGGGLFGGLLSFDGGGYTGTGARSGGVDGRGGFPAILHPNETVVDHSKGQGFGGGVNLTFAPVIDARGADAAAVARLEENQRRMAAEFEGRVHSVLRTGRNTRRNKQWSSA